MPGDKLTCPEAGQGRVQRGCETRFDKQGVPTDCVVRLILLREANSRVLWVCGLVLVLGSAGVADGVRKGRGIRAASGGSRRPRGSDGRRVYGGRARSDGGGVESGGHRRADGQGLSGDASQFVPGNPADLWRMGIWQWPVRRRFEPGHLFGRRNRSADRAVRATSGYIRHLRNHRGAHVRKRIKPGFYAGATVRALHESIGPEQASGFSVDLGLLYRFENEGSDRRRQLSEPGTDGGDGYAEDASAGDVSSRNRLAGEVVDRFSRSARAKTRFRGRAYRSWNCA